MSGDAVALPSRGICLVCRTLLDSGERCDLDPRHPTAQFDTPNGRERVLATVWGPPSARQQARQLTRAGASGGIAGGMAEIFAHGCSGCGELAGAGEAGAVLGVIAVVLAVAFSAVIVVWLVGKAVVAWQRRKHRLRPLGAPRALTAKGVQWVEGVVHAQAHTGSWSGERDCVAYGVEVLADEHRNGAVLLRDGRTAAFTLALDDGRRVEVPAGRARVWSDAEPPEVAREIVKGDALKAQLGPLATSDDEYDVLIPADRAEVALVNPGDRVRLMGALEPVASSREGYRDGAAVFRPAGVPHLARVGS